MWTDVRVDVTALVNKTATPGGVSPDLSSPLVTLGGGLVGGHISSIDPPLPTPTTEHVRVCGGCGDTSVHGLSYGCGKGCCLVLHYDGKWTLGEVGDTLAPFLARQL